MLKYLAICTSLTLTSYCVSSTAIAQERLNRTPVLEPTSSEIQIDQTPTTPGVDDLATPDDGPETLSVQHYPCSDITSCNVLIARCAEWDGTWVETGTPGPQGEPQKGVCTVSSN